MTNVTWKHSTTQTKAIKLTHLSWRLMQHFDIYLSCLTTCNYHDQAIQLIMLQILRNECDDMNLI